MNPNVATVVSDLVTNSLSTEMLAVVGGSSVAMMAISVIVTPMLLVRIPSDYFLREKPHLFRRLRQATPLRCCILLIKNAVGVVLLVAGLAMLVLPGQGLLTILIALMLLDFPGKFHVERALVGRPKIRAAIDWLRHRGGQPPLDL